MKKINYQAVLRNANKRNPGNPFVNSCAMFYVQNQYLTQLQVKSLRKVRKYNDPYRQYEALFGYEDLGETS